MMMRADIRNMDSFFLECGVGDIPMQFYSMAKGKVYYFDRIMSVYRHNHDGSWCVDTLNRDAEKVILHYARMIRFIKEYDRYTNKRYSRFINDLGLNYLFSVIFRCKDLLIPDFRQKIQSLMEGKGKGLREYIYGISEAYEQLFNDDYISSKLKEYVNNYQYIYIFGTGHYGTLLADRFTRNGIDYEGFVISDGFRGDEEYMGKKVCRVSQMYHGAEGRCIIAAVNIMLWKEVRKMLDDYEIADYCYMICV